MAATKTINSKYSIISKREMVPVVVNEIMTYLSANTLIDGCSCVLDIKVVLNELISNAVIHGNGEDLSKSVDINIVFDGEMLEFTIIDRGEEFTPEDKEEETLLCESNRGISICHILCKKLIYEFIEGRGNSAKAVFKLIKT